MVSMVTAEDAGSLALRLEIPRSFVAKILSRRPKAVEIREKGLVVYHGSRHEVIEWAIVRGVEQIIVGVDPVYAVLLQGRANVVVGGGDPAVRFARELVRKSGLRWVHEPFSAAR